MPYVSPHLAFYNVSCSLMNIINAKATKFDWIIMKSTKLKIELPFTIFRRDQASALPNLRPYSPIHHKWLKANSLKRNISPQIFLTPTLAMMSSTSYPFQKHATCLILWWSKNDSSHWFKNCHWHLAVYIYFRRSTQGTSLFLLCTEKFPNI